MDQGSKIREFRQVQINLLAEIDRICHEHQLTYWLDGGTLLGAIRHDGDFIPWDDDVDVAMPYDDYKKLIELFRPQQSWGRYRLIAPEYGTEKEIAKILDTGCTIVEETPSEVRESFAFVDIFPLVPVAKNMSLRTRWFIVASWLMAAHLHTYPFYIHWPAAVCRAVLWFLGTKRFYRSLEKYFARTENRDGEYYTYHWRAPFGFLYYQKAWYAQTEKHAFRDLQLNIPANWDNVLSVLYGDYMQYPPVEQQVFPHIIDFQVTANHKFDGKGE